MFPADYFGSLPMARQQMLHSESASSSSIFVVAPDNTPDHQPSRNTKTTTPGGLFIKQLRWLVTSLARPTPDTVNCALLSWRKAEGCLDGVHAFTFHDTKACEEQISHFFSTNKWDSLKRQLNNYGFLRLHDNCAHGSTWFHPHFTQEGKTDELIFKKPSAKKMRNLYSQQPLPKSQLSSQFLMSSQKRNGSNSLFDSLGALADAAEVISCHGADDVGGSPGGVRDLAVEKRRGGGTSIARVVTSSMEDLTQSEFAEDDFFATNEGSSLKKRPRGDDSINETAQRPKGVDDRDGDDADSKQPKIKFDEQSREVFEVDSKNSKKVPLDVCPSPLMPRAPSCHAVNLAGPGPISSSRQQHRHAHHPYQGPQKQVHAVQFPSQRPMHVVSAGGGFGGVYPKGVYAGDRVHAALQPQPQMPQPRLYQQQPSYNYHQQHQERSLQAQCYNSLSLYQKQILQQQQEQQHQLPYPFQYPIMQPPLESTTSWPAASSNKTFGLLQRTSGHPSTCSFAPSQSASGMAGVQTAPPPDLTTAESGHLQHGFELLDENRNQQLQLQRMCLLGQQQIQQQQPVQQQQQQLQLRDQVVPPHHSHTNIYIRRADGESGSSV